MKMSSNVSSDNGVSALILCLILFASTRIRIDSVMHLRSSSRGTIQVPQLLLHLRHSLDVIVSYTKFWKSFTFGPDLPLQRSALSKCFCSKSLSALIYISYCNIVDCGIVGFKHSM